MLLLCPFSILQIDLLCADVDNIKLSLAFPQARTNACVGSATAAVLSALHSAAAVAAATARGDDAAASRAAIAAAASAQAAAQHAQQRLACTQHDPYVILTNGTQSPQHHKTLR